ncbi:hypothetical protein C0J52_07167 [Blattella germanica]|nr:hypothetical protein C0J52_07167 [Blattella germanica]
MKNTAGRGAEDTKTEEINKEIKVEVIETELKEVNLEPESDENTKENDTSTEIKTEVENVESENKVPEESMVEEEIEPITTADTTHTAVACTIDGNVQFEESPQLATAGPIPGKIKINITKSLPAASSKEPQSEGETETSVADQNVDSESGPVTTEASRESGEEGIGEEEVDTGEPPPPGVEPVQLKPRLVGRKLTELPPVMKGTELSGLCSIM